MASRTKTQRNTTSIRVSHAGDASRPCRPQKATLPYLAGLDGLRAVAIIAVLLYHADFAWIPGGFLGVDVFFVLSGYLLSALLLAEWRATGHIDTPAFWLRRARRLLPAVYVLLAAALCFAVLALPGELARLRSDTLAALVYLTNWYLVLHQQSYFEAVARPSLLLHLWSLAVEEQFYLLLPLVLGLALRRSRPAVVAAGLLALALLSSLWMAWLYRPDADPSRVYYGTDTRAASLLLGTALAFVWIPRPPATRRSGRGVLFDICGVGALLILLWCFRYLHAYEPALYRGGFALVALATAVLIVVAIEPQAYFGTYVLGLPVLRWIGRRSYSIYLWHWPVFMLTRPQLDLQLSGLPLLVLRLVLTLMLAEASFRFVERPMRGGLQPAYAGAFRRVRATMERALRDAPTLERRFVGAVWAVNAGSAVLLCFVVVRAIASAEAPSPPAYLVVTAINTAKKGVPALSASSAPWPLASRAPSPRPLLGLALPTVEPAASLPPLDVAVPASPPAVPATLVPPTEVPPTPAPPTHVPPTAEPPPDPPTLDPPTPDPPVPDPAPAIQAAMPSEEPTAPEPAGQAPVPLPGDFGRVGAVGDSVMLSAALALQGAIPEVEIDAEVSRQVDGALAIAQGWQAGGQLGNVVVAHIGNNGVFTTQQFDALMQALAGVPRVYLLTVKVGRPWEAPNNAVIVEGVARHANTRLIDWRAASLDHPEYFWDDGIHLRPEGAAVYAELVRAQLSVPSAE